MASASVPASRSLPRFLFMIDGKLNEVSPFLTKLLFYHSVYHGNRKQTGTLGSWRGELRFSDLLSKNFPYWTVSLAPSPLFYTYENLLLPIFFHIHKAYPSLASFKKFVILNRFPVTISFVYETIRSMLTQLASNHCWLLYCCCLWIETKFLSNVHETQCNRAYLSIRHPLAMSPSSVDFAGSLSQGFCGVHVSFHPWLGAS